MSYDLSCIGSDPVDLTRIDNINVTMALALISAIGVNLSRFAKIGNITSWLGLCSGSKITDGKVMSGKARHVANRTTPQPRRGLLLHRMRTRDKPEAVLGAVATIDPAR